MVMSTAVSSLFASGRATGSVIDSGTLYILENEKMIKRLIFGLC